MTREEIVDLSAANDSFIGPTQDKIRKLAGLGIPIADIASLAGCSVADLEERGRYHEDVRRGLGEANAKVAQVMMDRAMAGNPAAMIFWAKCRMGWNEAGSKETANGKKTREVRKLIWTVIDGNKSSRSQQAKRTPKSPDGSTSRPLEPGVIEGRGSGDVSDAADPDAPVDGPAPAEGAVQGGARRPRGWEV
jgi:hypothetical protein